MCFAVPFEMKNVRWAVSWNALDKTLTTITTANQLTVNDGRCDDKNRLIASCKSTFIVFCADPSNFALLGETFERDNQRNSSQSICNCDAMKLQWHCKNLFTGHDDVTSYFTFPFSSMPITLYPFEIIVVGVFFLLLLFNLKWINSNRTICVTKVIEGNSTLVSKWLRCLTVQMCTNQCTVYNV